jgi:hypothetical protein
MAPRKVDLEEKRVWAPTPMIQEPFFELPAVATSSILDIEVPTPVVTPPVTTINENVEPVPQEPTETIVANEEKQQEPPEEEEGLKELGGHLFLTIMKSMRLKSFIWRVIPPLMKKP